MLNGDMNGGGGDMRRRDAEYQELFVKKSMSVFKEEDI